IGFACAAFQTALARQSGGAVDKVGQKTTHPILLICDQNFLIRTMKLPRVHAQASRSALPPLQMASRRPDVALSPEREFEISARQRVRRSALVATPPVTAAHESPCWPLR